MQFKATISDLLLHNVPIHITFCYSHGLYYMQWLLVVSQCVVFVMFLKGNGGATQRPEASWLCHRRSTAEIMRLSVSFSLFSGGKQAGLREIPRQITTS